MGKITIEVPEGLEKQIGDFFELVNSEGGQQSPEEKWQGLLQEGGLRVAGYEKQDKFLALVNELDQRSR